MRRAVLADCDTVTSEVHMKWDALQPAPDHWTTGSADALARHAREHGLSVRGHALLWEQSTPGWARRAVLDGDWSAVETHFSRVLGRYGTEVAEWDVVNEPVDEHGLKDNLFRRGLGSDYVARALELAHAIAPTARLFINDYSLEYDNAVEDGRRAALLKLVEDLKRQGVPLHGVGLQGHLDLGKGPLKPGVLDPFLRDLAGMGVEIAVTELDVNEQDRRLPLEVRDRRVADETRRYLEIVLAHEAVRSVTTWGLSDRHSWLQDQLPPGEPTNRGLPLDDRFRPKPMRQAIIESLQA
ncbi:MAG: endo-1,4-beta-xylanase [Brevundimonas sp.]